MRMIICAAKFHNINRRGRAAFDVGFAIRRAIADADSGARFAAKTLADFDLACGRDTTRFGLMTIAGRIAPFLFIDDLIFEETSAASMSEYVISGIRVP